MNLPIGALAAAGFWAYLHEKGVRGRGRIDHLSAGIFTVAIAAIMADLTALSTSGRLEIGLTTLVAVVAVVLFVLQERRSPEPMISLELWGRRPIAAANGASLLAGMVMIGLTTFLPMFVQGVMQQSPLIGGFALSAMVLGWPVGATVGVRVGLSASACAPVARRRLANSARLARFPRPQRGEFARSVAGLGSLVVGLGMGLSSSASIILIQEIVSWSERGSVTALLSLRPQSRQHVWRDRVRRRAQFRPPSIRPCRRDVRSASATPGAGFGSGGRTWASRCA